MFFVCLEEKKHYIFIEERKTLAKKREFFSILGFTRVSAFLIFKQLLHKYRRNLYYQYNDNPKNLCYHTTIRNKQGTNGKRPGKEMTMNRFNNALSYLYSSLYLSPAFSKGFIVMRSYRDKDRECMDSVV